MDLLLLLAALYAWECLRTIPPHGVVFTSLLRRSWRVRYGGGIHFLPFWPSAGVLVSAWFPFRVDGARLHSSIPLGRTGLPDHRGDERCLLLRSDSVVSTAGPVLKVDGIPFVRVTSSSQAHCLRRLCLRLARRAPARRPQAWRAALRRSWSIHSARLELSRVRRATRWLAMLCSAYVTVVFVAAPVAILLLGEDLALLALAPIVLVLHGATVLLLHRAVGKLRLPFGPARWERTVVGALYPPALWRAPQDLANEALVGFGPNAVAGVVLDGDGLGTYVRRRQAILGTQRAHLEEGETDPDLERRSLQRLLEAGDVNYEAALDPMGGDPEAAAYCPVCLSGYVRDIEMCDKCGVGIVGRSTDQSIRYATDTTA